MTSSRIVDEWDHLLGRFDESRRDVYYRPAYASLYAGGDVKARCFIRSSGDDLYLMPFLEHPNRFLGEDRFDISTPYGYGGPISTTDDPAFISESSAEMYEMFARAGAVTGFIRCHPMLMSHERLDARWNVQFDRHTIGMDLTVSEDALWRDVLTNKGRNRVKKACAGGLDFEVDDGFGSTDDFMQVYHETMQLVGATSFYYFDSAYFEQISRAFRDCSFVARATIGGRLIAAMLFLCDGVHAHAHLSCSVADFRDLGPNNFVIYNGMLEAKRRGCTRFHLGGGATNRSDDSLLRFKSCFSRDRFEFHLGRTVFDPTAYEEASALWLAEQPAGAQPVEERFPVYGLMGPAA